MWFSYGLISAEGIGAAFVLLTFGFVIVQSCVEEPQQSMWVYYYRTADRVNSQLPLDKQRNAQNKEVQQLAAGTLWHDANKEKLVSTKLHWNWIDIRCMVDFPSATYLRPFGIVLLSTLNEDQKAISQQKEKFTAESNSFVDTIQWYPTLLSTASLWWVHTHELVINWWKQLKSHTIWSHT